MQTRRDHVHAYHFAVSRLSTALTGADLGTGGVPFRRVGTGVVVGSGLAVLLCLVAFIFGWLDPAASTSWRQRGAIVVEKETGTRFVYLDGVLHPTLNYTSARLISGSSNGKVAYVPRRNLASVPVGATLGIPDAPQTLPLASALLPGRWAVCLAPGQSGGVTLRVPNGPAAPLGNARALVTGLNQKTYVIWHNTKYPLLEQSALVALGFGNVQPVPAPVAWLDTLATGPVLAPPAHFPAGQAGPTVAGRPSQVGALFDSLAAGVIQYYVALPDGLAPVSRTELALMEALRGAAPTLVSPADIAAAPVSADRKLLSFVPNLLTGVLYQPGGTPGALCVQQVSPGRSGQSTVVTEPAAGSAVLVPADAGVIAQAPVTASQSTLGVPPQQYLITGSGKKYPLAYGTLDTLGYPTSAVRIMPATILQLVPNGPLLSAATAAKAVSWRSS